MVLLSSLLFVFLQVVQGTTYKYEFPFFFRSMTEIFVILFISYSLQKYSFFNHRRCSYLFDDLWNCSYDILSFVLKPHTETLTSLTKNFLLIEFVTFIFLPYVSGEETPLYTRGQNFFSCLHNYNSMR